MKGPAVRRHRGVRPRIQRAFLDWYFASRSRFAVPLHLESRTDSSLKASFAGVTRAISVHLYPTGLDVSVEWEGQWLDMLLSLDAAPRAVQGGYVCSMCEPDKRLLFASRESLWADHLFEPFLRWINDRLDPARWIRIDVLEGGSSAASLLSSEEELRGPDPTLRLFTELTSCPREPDLQAGVDAVGLTLLPIRARDSGN